MQTKRPTKLTFVIATYKKGIMSIIPIINSKNSPMDYAQDIIDKISPDMYVIAAEAWMRFMNNTKGKDYLNNYTWGDISKDPKKKECLTFFGKTKNGKEQYYRIFKINRKKIKIRFKEWLDVDGQRITMKSSKLT